MTLGNNDVPPRESRGFARDLVEAARENPASTALIGVGLLWMVLGRDGGSVLGKARDLGRTAIGGIGAGGRAAGAGASSLAASVSSAVSDGFATVAGHASDVAASASLPDVGASASRGVAEGATRAASAGSSTLSSIGEGVRAATHDARDVASDTAVSLGASDGRVAGDASQRASDLLASLRDGFADLSRNRPFVLGAVGLAVGAGVAVALPRIAAEDAVAGTVGGLKESLREGFSGAYDRAASEARAQGLTPEAASRAMSEVGDRIATVAKATAEEARANLS